jgi:hypothetical protein
MMRSAFSRGSCPVTRTTRNASGIAWCRFSGSQAGVTDPECHVERQSSSLVARDVVRARTECQWSSVAERGTAARADAATDCGAGGHAVSGDDQSVSNGERYRTVRFDYHDGLRYPHLERTGSTPGRLDEILTPRK